MRKNSLAETQMALITSDKEFKERLIKTVKKEVKQIMEEAVTRKFVHQDSSSVTSLCAAVECCLSHGLRRRALGLFRTSSTTALMHKVAKTYRPAETVSKLILEAEAAEGVKRSSSSGDSTTRMLSSAALVSKPPLQKRNSGSLIARSTAPKYLWIRIALFERILVGIIEHLVDNHQKYYEKEALVADPEYGSVLSHLLVGPCALEYTRMKTQDHYWTDPPADELVQRHRISSGAYGSAGSGATSPANRRPGLQYRKLISGAGSGDGGDGPVGSSCGRSFHSSTAIDYVESLHQNNKVVLLYGKNNVLVLPRDLTEPIPGYLSLHQSGDNLTLKWTPNQLMNGAIDCDGVDKSAYWDYALHVNLHDIVYVHCHQQGSDAGGTMVLVGQDGVQCPAIHFPAGGHLLAFLTCLETALQPHGRLDPPLWSQTGKGKVFPKIKRKGAAGAGASSSASATAASVNCKDQDNGNGREESADGSAASVNETSDDYVFRIMVNNIAENPGTEALEEGPTSVISSGSPAGQMAATSSPRSPRWWLSGRGHSRPFRSADSMGSSSSSSSKSLSTSLSLVEHNHMSSSTGNVAQAPYDGESPRTPLQKGDSLHVLCETMKRQIISRAFYGWLAHCRHLRTVRTHLSGLVNETIVSCKEPADASAGINNESWNRLLAGGVLTDSFELYRLTYYGGVAHHLRKQVWPYLLGHYPFGSTADQRESQDRAVQTAYETTMSEWLAVEAIIRQRDKEVTAASIAKLSSGSHSDSHHDAEQLQRQGRSLSNEVFDDDFSDCSDSEVRVMESEEKDDPAAATTTVLTSTEEATSQDGTTVTVITTHPSSGSEHASEPESLDAGRRASDNEAIPRVLLPEEGAQQPQPRAEVKESEELDDQREHGNQLNVDDALDGCSIGSRSSCMSPASSAGGVYSMQLLETFGLNLHRIDKDVQRCDRNYHYFTPANLEKLRNIMCTYVWCHLDTGYMQGMCDLVAPLLVIIDDEALTYSCFCELMKRMGSNFPQGGAMDNHFANMRSLIQILDAEIFDLMHQNGDYTHFYFCYRWFLLDFKRELVYDDVFTVWETIWAARSVASSHFVLFVALALVQYYRDIILSNAMDFTDIIKFFNEMAERHDAKAVLRISRELVLQLQTLIENK